MIVRRCCVCQVVLGRVYEPGHPEERVSHGYCPRHLAEAEAEIDRLVVRAETRRGQRRRTRGPACQGGL